MAQGYPVCKLHLISLPECGLVCSNRKCSCYVLSKWPLKNKRIQIPSSPGYFKLFTSDIRQFKCYSSVDMWGFLYMENLKLTLRRWDLSFSLPSNIVNGEIFWVLKLFWLEIRHRHFEGAFWLNIFRPTWRCRLKSPPKLRLQITKRHHIPEPYNLHLNYYKLIF